MCANIEQQYLKAGLVNEIRIHLVPALVGGGISLFGEIGKLVRLEKTKVIDAPEGVHMIFRVK